MWWQYRLRDDLPETWRQVHFCQLAQKDLLPDGRQPPQGSARTTAFRPGPQKRHRLVTLPKPGAVDSFAETLFVVLSHVSYPTAKAGGFRRILA